MTRVPEFDEEWGQRFIDQMHDYVYTLEAALDDDNEIEVDTISGVPFCGCSDCYERETYLMAVKLAIEGYEQGKVRLVDVEG